MICAQCHSFRDIYAKNFKAGENYYDFFTPVMEYRLPASEDPAYWPDGRPRQLSNEAFGLWQSQCYLKGGATCATCHTNPHNNDVEQESTTSARQQWSLYANATRRLQQTFPHTRIMLRKVPGS